jgi:hypothetical protein
MTFYFSLSLSLSLSIVGGTDFPRHTHPLVAEAHAYNMLLNFISFNFFNDVNSLFACIDISSLLDLHVIDFFNYFANSNRGIDFILASLDFARCPPHVGCWA